jgi:hypothetical protein
MIQSLVRSQELHTQTITGAPGLTTSGPRIPLHTCVVCITYVGGDLGWGGWKAAGWDSCLVTLPPQGSTHDMTLVFPSRVQPIYLLVRLCIFLWPM